MEGFIGRMKHVIYDAVKESEDRLEALSETRWVLDSITDDEAEEAEQRLARGRKHITSDGGLGRSYRPVMATV